MSGQYASERSSGDLTGSGPLAALFRRTEVEEPSERFWWGVDPSTVRAAISVVNQAGELVAVRTHVYSKHEPRSLERLAAIRRETDRVFRSLAVDFPPAFVLVEEPGGGWDNKVEPSLAYAVGAILSCVPIVGRGSLIPVASWKLQATGHGYMPGIPPAPKEASKADKTRRQRERARAEKARIMRWAVEQGYEGDSQDEADAVGIAFACRALQTQPEQLALA